jgi:hypothetical protein
MTSLILPISIPSSRIPAIKAVTEKLNGDRSNRKCFGAPCLTGFRSPNPDTQTPCPRVAVP